MKAVIYARVSSKDQEREGYSIPAQIEVVERIRGITRLQDRPKEFIDIETAKMSGRKQFGEMVRFLEQNPE